MTAALAIREQLLVPQWEPKHTLHIDFETFWDQDYSLEKLGTSDYVRDPRFETIGVGVHDGEHRRWMEHEEFVAFAKTVPWHETAVSAFHAQFDGLILSHHYQCFPAFFFCPLSMARSFGLQDSNSLGEIARRLDVGEKGTEAIESKGLRRRDMPIEFWVRYGRYCLNDVELCKAVLERLGDGFPESELWVINSIVQMFVRPRVFLDAPLLQDYLRDEKARKQGLLARVEKDKSIIMSGDKFAAELRALGVDPPKKPSPKKRNPDGSPVMIWAFAKSDPQMQDLLEDEDEEVRWLAETRIALKSTINETRTERFLKSGVLPDGQLRPVPVYLKYYGAHTGRCSGADKRNFQNLERTNKKNPKKGVLRKGLLAPFAQKFVAADSGAIEAKVNAWLAGHTTLIEAFANKADVYSEFMSEVMGRKVDRKNNPEDETLGFVGKICVLGLGYQLGWPKLAGMFLRGAMNGPPVQFGHDMVQQLGIDLNRFVEDEWKMKRVNEMVSRITKEELIVHCAVAEAIVKKWRALNKPIVELWGTMEHVLEAMLDDDADYTFGPGDCMRVKRHAIVLPNGMQLRYPGLKYSAAFGEDRGGFSYNGAYGQRKYTYGGSLTENVVQALARIIVTDQMLHIKATTGHDPALFTHDDLAYVVPDAEAASFSGYLQATMKVPPQWAVGLPLSVEGGFHQSYGGCK